MTEFKTGYTCPNCGNHYNNALSSNPHTCIQDHGSKERYGRMYQEEVSKILGINPKTLNTNEA